MTDGLKPGAGSDPFEDDSDTDGDNRPEQERRSEDAGDDSDTENKDDRDGQSSVSREQSISTETTDADSSLPWIYSRDGVKKARQHTFQLHLQASTRDREKRFQADIEEALGEDVYKADLREAALLVAMDRHEAVLDQLREWGYDAD